MHGNTCNHFVKKEEKIEEKKQEFEKINTKLNNENKNILKTQKNNTLPKNKANNRFKFFSYLIVLIISFIALLILIDTFKTPLYSKFPKLENDKNATRGL